jgi:hypothetical protein
MFGLLDKVLSKLPLNGWKTEIGVIVTLAAELVLPGQALYKQIGEAILAAGVFHKALKKMKKSIK